MKKIKISIIVPVYNVEKYLSKCLESLVHQTLKDIEILIINDGSTDNSQKIIDRYIRKYPNLIKSYFKKNGGQGSARNYGISISKGEYIAFVDGDDFVDVEMMKFLYDEAISNNSDIVICGNLVVNEDEKIVKIENMDNEQRQNYIFGKMAVWNKIYKRELIVNNNISFRENVWYEDLDFTMKLLFLSKKIDIINLPLYNYLIRKGSTMNNSNIEKNLDIVKSFDELKNYCKKRKIYDIHYEEIEYIAIDNIYISSIVRILRMKITRKLKLEVINELLNYFYTNFPNFRKNKYIKNLSISRKVIYFLLKYKLYDIIYIIYILKK